MIRRRKPRAWAHTAAATGWGESTFAELAWDKSRGAAMRWGLFGAVVGMLLALLLFAPAAWLAGAVASATNQHLLLAEARGTVWSGSAVAVLTGGPGSRDASALPGRIEWRLVPAGLGLELRARQACCLNGTATLVIRPGLGRVTVALKPGVEWIGQWPSAWLGGLGTPWKTLQMGGSVRLSSPGLAVESVQGRWRLTGRADVDLLEVSSRLSTLDTLGSYRLTISGDPSGAAQLNLATQQGALQLSGSGSIAPTGVRFRGEARAGEGEEAALANLLNIIGRRDGARSVISIG
jgi:general secretion pathway protein N